MHKPNQHKIQEKLILSKDIHRHLDSLKKKNISIGFTNGCFDILHLGHIEYLAKAANLCDFLIVGLNSDESVKNLKGKTRPINNYESRSKLLASLFYIDAVIEFKEETPIELIKKILPDFLIKGGDYKEEEIVGYDVVKDNGGQTITIDLVPGYSTSNIEKQIRENRS